MGFGSGFGVNFTASTRFSGGGGGSGVTAPSIQSGLTFVEEDSVLSINLVNNDADNPAALDLSFSDSILKAPLDSFDNGTTTSPSYVLEPGETRAITLERDTGSPSYGDAASSCTISALLADGSTSVTSVTVEGAAPSTDYANWEAVRSGADFSLSSSGVTFSFGTNLGKWFDNNFSGGSTGGAITGTWNSGGYIVIDLGQEKFVDQIRIWVDAPSGNAWSPAGSHTVRTTVYGDTASDFSGQTTLANNVEIYDGGNITTADGSVADDIKVNQSGDKWRREYTLTGGFYRYLKFQHQSGAGHGYWYTTEIQFKVN